MPVVGSRTPAPKLLRSDQFGRNFHSSETSPCAPAPRASLVEVAASACTCSPESPSVRPSLARHSTLPRKDPFEVVSTLKLTYFDETSAFSACEARVLVTSAASCPTPPVPASVGAPPTGVLERSVPK